MFDWLSLNIHRRLAPALVLCCTFIFWSPAPAPAQVPVARGSQIPTLAPTVKETAPSVVNISVQARVQEDNPLYRDPVFRQFLTCQSSSKNRCRRPARG